MKFRIAWLALAAAALAVPGAVWAQEDEQERPGMIGVTFSLHTTRSDRDPEGRSEVVIEHVRRGSPAEAAGVNEGDVVIRINGRPAVDSFRELDLHEGETVQLRIQRDGDERDVAIVAGPRPVTRFGIARPGPGDGPMIFVGPDSIPLQALTMRIDSLQTRLLELNGGEVRVHMDSLITLFSDSANVFIQRLPNMEFRMQGPDLERLEGELAELEDLDIETRVFGLQGELGEMERPFFMELGRRAAAGAELAEMNEGLRRYFDNVQGGALVIDVSPNTPAARAGLEAGDVIVRAAGREVNDPEDVRRALMGEEDGSVALEVVRQGRRRELTLQWQGGDRIIRREVAPARVRVHERAPRTRERAPGPARTPEPVRAPAPPRN
ncbi:MAG TPA: PDZ domain-containing protein [Longimicrobium sp.]